MDFALCPPEVNSSLMYTGPGAQPLLAAASAWEGIAAQIGSTAESISRVVCGLGGMWRGDSAARMTETAARYQSWLMMTASQASQTAARAMTAAGAFEAAFAATVPPAVVAANRSLLATLVATNFLGVNTPAIMATEAHYAEMWAQDVMAMANYQIASAEAAVLPLFSPPVALTTDVQAGVVSILAGLQNFTPQSFSDLAAAAQSFTGLGGLAFAPIAGVMDEGLWGSPQWGQQTGQANVQPYRPNSEVSASGESAGGSASPEVEAGIGRAQQVGSLSTPQSWGSTVNKGVAAEKFTPGTAAPLSEAGTSGEVEGFAPAMAPVPAPMGFPGGRGSQLGRDPYERPYGIPIGQVIPHHPSGG